MRFKSYALVLICFWVGNCLASEESSLDTLLAELKERVLVTGTFTQNKTIKGLSKSIQSTGFFVYWREQGIYLQTEQPFFNGVTIGKNGAVQWLAPGEINSNSVPENLVRKEINTLLLSILTADLVAIEERFSLSWSLRDTHWSVVLMPKSKLVAKALSRVELGGRRGQNSALEFVNVVQEDGGITALTFENRITVLNGKPSPDLSLNEAIKFCEYFLIDHANCQPLIAADHLD